MERKVKNLDRTRDRLKELGSAWTGVEAVWVY